MYKINKDLFEKLYDEDITHKQYQSIVSLIENRVDEIIQKICTPYRKQNTRIYYYYSTGAYDGDPGHFDPQIYKDNVGFALYEGHCKEPFAYEFPTRWLYEDYEDEMQKIIQDHEEYKLSKMTNKKKQLLVKKQQKEELLLSIKSKLNPEELKFLKVK